MSSPCLLSDQAASRLFSSISNPINLELIHAEFWKCDYLGDDTLQSFSALLSSAASVTKVIFIFGWCGKVTAEGILGIASGLTTHTNLTYVYLDFSGSSITDDEAIQLFEAIFLQQNIEQVCIILNSCSNIRDRTANRLAELLETQDTIYDLGFQIEMTQISEEAKANLRRIKHTRKFKCFLV
eukprot:TRINITY_DN7026_c0_g3_i4.p1 TRINITY_DN7026_c0_g3~~TRINITY_DN7026_c0_g3_i4.p1  ORF type:complete len:183 (-),score=2.16 TRINITY_DN7026_c0_g3_i4:130-678(-)